MCSGCESGGQDGAYDAGGAGGEDDAVVADEAPGEGADVRSCFFGSGDEEAAVAYEMAAYRLEVIAICRAGAPLFILGRLKRGDEVALEEVGAGGKRDWVCNGGFESGGGGGEEGEGFGDGGGGGVGEEED